MIELTDEQKKEMQDYDSVGLSCIDAAEYLLNSLLTLPQTKQLAEQHNAIVVQWLEFDVNDKSTWPVEDLSRNGHNLYNKIRNEFSYWCLNQDSKKVYFDIKRNVWKNGKNKITNVTHWVYLPQPNGEKND